MIFENVKVKQIKKDILTDLGMNEQAEIKLYVKKSIIENDLEEDKQE